MRYLRGRDYPHLCEKCRDAIDKAWELYTSGVMPDTDDPEAPIMYAGDHGWLHRFECPDEGEDNA